MHRPIGPAAYDYVRLVIVRDGTAIAFTEFGQKPISTGHVVMLGPNVLFGLEPEGQVTCTTIYIDTDLALDHFFWQYAAILHDRLDAHDRAEEVYTEPAQLLHIGREKAGMLRPWLDEMVSLSEDGMYHQRFHRLEALWLLIVDVIAPHVRVSPLKLTAEQRARARPFSGTVPIPEVVQREAMIVRDALHSRIAHPWTLAELAKLVELSPKHVAPVFARAFGKTPTVYLVRLRVQEMARLLRETNLTVTHIGKRVGWRSRSRAVDAFTQQMGVTPSGYRQMKPRVSARGAE